MVYKKEAWIAAIQKAIVDLKTDKPTSGLPCAVAGLRYIRDGLLDDLIPKPEAGKQPAKHDVELRESIRESFSELIGAITTAKSVDDGFLSNASAAAKSAGFKTTAEEITKLVD